MHTTIGIRDIAKHRELKRIMSATTQLEEAGSIYQHAHYTWISAQVRLSPFLCSFLFLLILLFNSSCVVCMLIYTSIPTGSKFGGGGDTSSALVVKILKYNIENAEIENREYSSCWKLEIQYVTIVGFSNK